MYTELKKFDEAEKIYNRVIQSGYKHDDDDEIFLAYLYKQTGRMNEANSLLTKLISRVENQLKTEANFMLQNFIKFRLAAAYALLDKQKIAIRYLSELFETGVWEYPFKLSTFTGFDNLRSDPEFKALFKRIEDEKASFRAQVNEMERRGEINL
jgi:tetratricopeptide (TPR) repeat protein